MIWIFRLWLIAFLFVCLGSLVEQNIYRADLLASTPQLGELSLSLLSAMNLTGVIATLLLLNWRKSGIVLAFVVQVVVITVHFTVAADALRISVLIGLFVLFGFSALTLRRKFSTRYNFD